MKIQNNMKIVTIPQKFIFQSTSSLPAPLPLLKLPIRNWKRSQQNYLKRTKQRAIKTITNRKFYFANKGADQF